MRPLYIFLFIFSVGISHAQSISENDLLGYMSVNNLNLENYTQVIQAGNENNATIDGNNVSVLQNGDNQSFHYTHNSITPTTLEVNMTGNGNYVEVFGNNQISENMSINVVGSDQSIVIRNYQ